MSNAVTDPILEALKVFLNGFKQRFEQHLNQQQAPPNSKFLLLHCIDYRYPSRIHVALDEVFAERYDQVVLAGASLAGVIDFGPPGPKLHWSQTLIDHVLLSRRLHHIAAIIVLEHRDCGAYKEFAHVPEHPDPYEEEQEHTRQYERFVQLLARNIPHDPKLPELMLEAHLLGEAPHLKNVYIKELSSAKLLKQH